MIMTDAFVNGHKLICGQIWWFSSIVVYCGLLWCRRLAPFCHFPGTQRRFWGAELKLSAVPHAAPVPAPPSLAAVMVVSPPDAAAAVHVNVGKFLVFQMSLGHFTLMDITSNNDSPSGLLALPVSISVPALALSALPPTIAAMLFLPPCLCPSFPAE